MNLTQETRNNKAEVIRYFRSRASEILSEIRLEHGNAQYKLQASAVNKKLAQVRTNLISTLLQIAERENWSAKERLESILTINYCNYVVMLESRNEVWQYDYMAFSRRIGELWEPFCKLCFEYPIKDVQFFVPPLFAEVKAKLTDEIEEYIAALQIPLTQKVELNKYYQKIWSLVVSGEIQLELDLHFIQNGKKYVVDFKSGFGSNEKGNTNRLLLVATIYRNLEEGYNCLIFVRSDDNNHYYQTLKNSGIWSAFNGNNTYQKIAEFTGFDLRNWIDKNVDWLHDLNQQTVSDFNKNNLTQYLSW
jgi:hypothetical protein